MPELPEVETARLQLAAWFGDQHIAGVRIEDPAVVRVRLSSRPGDGVADPVAATAPWVGAQAGRPARHGKRLAVAFGDSGMLAHLGMSGKWVLRSSGEVPRHGRLGLALADGSVCWLVDPRRFGCVTVCPAVALAGALADGLGPDALTSMPDGAGLAALFRVGRPIKVALLDQGRLAGLGNIHAAEALWRAGIHPDRPADRLVAGEWRALAGAITAQLASGLVGLAGQAEVTYVSEGGDDDQFAVYGRFERPCPRCAGTVAHALRGGRTTWWCPRCQPLA